MTRISIPGEDAGDKVVDGDDGGRCAIPGRDLLARDGERGLVHAGAAPFLGDGNAIETHFRQTLQRFARKLLVAVPARSMRRELLGRVTAYRLTDFLSLAGHR